MKPTDHEGPEDGAGGLRRILPDAGDNSVDLLRRLKWLRRELNTWDAVEGNRPMPQPTDFGLDLPNQHPWQVRWDDDARPLSIGLITS